MREFTMTVSRKEYEDARKLQYRDYKIALLGENYVEGYCATIDRVELTDDIATLHCSCLSSCD